MWGVEFQTHTHTHTHTHTQSCPLSVSVCYMRLCVCVQEVQTEPVLNALRDTRKKGCRKTLKESLPSAHLPIRTNQEYSKSESTSTLTHYETNELPSAARCNMHRLVPKNRSHKGLAVTLNKHPVIQFIFI